MNSEEVAIAITDLKRRETVSEKRIADLEEQQKQIQELTISVRELALSVKNMVDEQQNQRAEHEKLAGKVKEIESRPDKENSKMVTDLKGKILWLLVGGVIAYMFFLATGIQI